MINDFAMSKELVNRINVDDLIQYYSPYNKLCAIIGCSGSGKSTLERHLITSHKKQFFKLPQVTTREPREGEVHGIDYYFLENESLYNDLKPMLIGRICSNDFNGNHYGTLPFYHPNKINTIVVCAEALRDIIDCKFIWFDLTVIYLKMNPERITNGGKRKDRDIHFVEQEIESIENVMEAVRNNLSANSNHIRTFTYDYDKFDRFPEPKDIFNGLI